MITGWGRCCAYSKASNQNSSLPWEELPAAAVPDSNKSCFSVSTGPKSGSRLLFKMLQPALCLQSPEGIQAVLRGALHDIRLDYFPQTGSADAFLQEPEFSPDVRYPDRCTLWPLSIAAISGRSGQPSGTFPSYVHESAPALRIPCTHKEQSLPECKVRCCTEFIRALWHMACSL